MESQEAEFAALKWEVMTGWEEAMRVLSKLAMNWAARIWLKMSQKRVGEDSPRKMRDLAVEEEDVEEDELRRRRGECSVGGSSMRLSTWTWILFLAFWLLVLLRR